MLKDFLFDIFKERYNIPINNKSNIFIHMLNSGFCYVYKQQTALVSIIELALFSNYVYLNLNRGIFTIK